MFTIILLTALLATGFSWELNTTHTNVILKLTDDVTFCCANNNPHNDTTPDIDHLTRIRLLKLHDSGSWEDVAEIVLPDTSQPILADPTIPDISVSAHLGLGKDVSYLSVTWATASETTVGTYKCEVDGFSEGKDAHIYTNIVSIVSTTPSVSNLVDVILSMRHETKKTSEGLKKIEAQVKLREEAYEAKIMNRVRSMIEETYPAARYWPNGKYSLMSTSMGCPSTSYSELTTGYAKVKTRTSSTRHHDFPPHFHKDVFERSGTQNTLNFRFCKYPTSGDSEVIWPKGAYCLHCYQNSGCPPGFKYGYINVFLKSTSSLTYTENNIGDSINSDNSGKRLYLNFCCRNDGNAKHPIMLPSNHPFYLNRYKGKCQEVRNMNVTEETLFLDTDEAKTDKYDNSINPDSDLNDFKLYMCYYSPRT